MSADQRHRSNRGHGQTGEGAERRHPGAPGCDGEVAEKEAPGATHVVEYKRNGAPASLRVPSDLVGKKEGRGADDQELRRRADVAAPRAGAALSRLN